MHCKTPLLLQLNVMLNKHNNCNRPFKERSPGLVLLLSILMWFLTALASVVQAVERPNLMLLTEYSANQNVVGWVMSEKLDGVRAYWDGQRLTSRNGLVFSAPDWFFAGFPPFALDGELWLGRGQFEQTVSIVNTQMAHQDWQKISYQVFEVPNQPGGLMARLGVLSSYLKTHNVANLRVIEQTPIVEQTQLQAYLTTVLALGGEGVVVRDPHSLYQVGRLNSAQKVKLKQDAECVLQGYTPGKGKYTDQVGALLCQLAEGTFNDVNAARRVIKIGSGLSDQQRAEGAARPKIGECITFQYQGVTKNNVPRFPVFLRVRKEGCQP